MDTREQATWSFNLGRWAGATVEIHLFFAAFVLLTFAWAWFGVHDRFSHTASTMGIVTVGLMILASSLVVHEIGHFLAGHRARGHVSHVTMMPWGGVDRVFLPSSQGKILFYLSGPFANLLVAVACLAVLKLGLDQRLSWQFLNPIQPELHLQLNDPDHISALKFIFWVNWLLFLVNILPGLPFDGGHLVPAILRVLCPTTPRQTIVRLASGITVACALGLLITAFVVNNQAATSRLPGGSSTLYPTWMVLFPLAVTLLFSARLYAREPVDDGLEEWSYEALYREEESLEANAFYDDDEFFETDDDESISDWLMERQADRERNLRRIEQEEETQADDILAKLHKHGLESLTEDERSLLQRVSARYRKRTQGPSGLARD